MAKLRVNPTASQAFLRGYSRSEAGILLLVRIWLWTPLIASAALSLVVLAGTRPPPSPPYPLRMARMPPPLLAPPPRASRSLMSSATAVAPWPPPPMPTRAQTAITIYPRATSALQLLTDLQDGAPRAEGGCVTSSQRRARDVAVA